MDAYGQVCFKSAQYCMQEKYIFEFRQFIFALTLLSPLGKGCGHFLNKLEIPSPKDALCQVELNFVYVAPYKVL